MKVHKFKLDIHRDASLSLPEEHKFLHADYIQTPEDTKKHPFVWFQVSGRKNSVEKLIRIVPTGVEIASKEETAEYIATFKVEVNRGAYKIFHIYQIRRKTASLPAYMTPKPGEKGGAPKKSKKSGNKIDPKFL